MKLCQFLVFGHGYDGEDIHADYDDSGILNYLQKTKMVVVGGDQESSLKTFALEEKEQFTVLNHKSEVDGKVYLIATADGLLPERIDDRIRATKIEESPF